MKVLNGLLWGLFLLGMSACSSETTTVKPKQGAQTTHVSAFAAEHLDKFELSKKGVFFDADFFTDSLKNHERFPLRIGIVKELKSKLAADDESQRMQYYINDFIKISTAKREGRYQQFLDELSIGMTKEAHCFGVYQQQLGDSLTVLYWKITYSSFDACPLFNGTNILASLYHNQRLIRTYFVAGEEEGIDPPMAFRTVQYSHITSKGNVVGRTFSLTYEDEEVAEREQEHFKGKITKKGLLLESTAK